MVCFTCYLDENSLKAELLPLCFHGSGVRRPLRAQSAPGSAVKDIYRGPRGTSRGGACLCGMYRKCTPQYILFRIEALLSTVKV